MHTCMSNVDIVTVHDLYTVTCIQAYRNMSYYMHRCCELCALVHHEFPWTTLKSWTCFLQHTFSTTYMSYAVLWSDFHDFPAEISHVSHRRNAERLKVRSQHLCEQARGLRVSYLIETLRCLSKDWLSGRNE